MEPVRTRELLVAARLADALVYVAGAAGIAAGAVLYQRGDPQLAVVAWVLTFVAGAVLRLAAWIARGIAQLLAQIARLGEDVHDLRVEQVATERREGRAGRPDPHGPWTWHR